MKGIVVASLLGMSSAMAQSAAAQSVVEAPKSIGSLKGTMLAPEAGAGRVDPPRLGADRSRRQQRLRIQGCHLSCAGREAGGARHRLCADRQARGRCQRGGGSRTTGPSSGRTMPRTRRPGCRPSARRRARPASGAGRSEDALVALDASRTASDACGLFLVSTPRRSAATVLRDPFHSNPANASVLADADRATNSLAAGPRIDVSGMRPALHGSSHRPGRGRLNSIMALDPAKPAAADKGLMLIVRGVRDL